MIRACNARGAIASLGAAVAAVLLPAVPAGAELWIPDSAGDRIMKFSSVDGSLIDLNFITNASTGGKFLLPFEAKQVGNEAWVSDQNADAIYRFTTGGAFLGSFLDDDAGPNVTATADLVNIRGFEVLGNRLFVANADGRPGEGGNNPSIRIFDATTGAGLGAVRPPQVDSPYDVQAFNGGLLVAEPANIDITPRLDRGFIQRLDAQGNYQGLFASGNGSTGGGTMTTGGVTTPNNGLRGPHQMLVLRNGNVMVANSTGSPLGIFEFDPSGNIVDFYSTVAEGREFRPQGLAELENGRILITGTDNDAAQNGIFSLNLANEIITPILKVRDLPAGQGLTPMYVNHVNAVPEPTSLLSLAGAAATLLLRRRSRLS